MVAWESLSDVLACLRDCAWQDPCVLILEVCWDLDLPLLSFWILRTSFWALRTLLSTICVQQHLLFWWFDLVSIPLSVYDKVRLPVGGLLLGVTGLDLFLLLDLVNLSIQLFVKLVSHNPCLFQFFYGFKLLCDRFWLHLIKLILYFWGRWVDR